MGIVHKANFFWTGLDVLDPVGRDFRSLPSEVYSAKDIDIRETSQPHLHQNHKDNLNNFQFMFSNRGSLFGYTIHTKLCLARD